MCESQPTCVCFSPSKPNLVIAGIVSQTSLTACLYRKTTVTDNNA